MIPPKGDPNALAMRSSAMSPVIVWFRQDLRLADNPALRRRRRDGRAADLRLFVLDDETPGDWRLGGASRWWLHHSLASLDCSLKGHLVLRRGEACTIIKTLAKETEAHSSGLESLL